MIRSVRPPSTAFAADTVEEFIGTSEVATLLGVSVSTVQKLVEKGRLEAWKTEGGHRRIKLSSVETMAHELHARHGDQLAVRGRLRILIVEDNRPTLKLYEKVMSQWGEALELHTASDGAEALLTLARVAINVVVTDLAMQPLDGFALIRAIRADPQLSNLRVIVVTALDAGQIASRGGLDAGVVCYEKPAPFARIAGYLDAQLQLGGFLLAGKVLQ